MPALRKPSSRTLAILGTPPFIDLHAGTSKICGIVSILVPTNALVLIEFGVNVLDGRNSETFLAAARRKADRLFVLSNLA